MTDNFSRKEVILDAAPGIPKGMKNAIFIFCLISPGIDIWLEETQNKKPFEVVFPVE